MLVLDRCAAGYAGRIVFSNLSLEIAEGETLAVVGPSGCGKSTLLYAAAGLLQPLDGTVRLDRTPVAPGDRRIGLILQQYGLFPWFTVLDNVALGLRLHGQPRAERLSAARTALDAVGVGALERRYIATLSGGEQQRVAIARTWAMQPRLLLMDEPFSALDALTRETLQDLLRSLLRTRTIASILVTHSMEEAVLLGSRIAVMHGRPARLEYIDNPIARANTREVRMSARYFSTISALRRRFEELVDA